MGCPALEKEASPSKQQAANKRSKIIDNHWKCKAIASKEKDSK